jgi:hypothetical protein
VMSSGDSSVTVPEETRPHRGHHSSRGTPATDEESVVPVTKSGYRSATMPEETRPHQGQSCSELRGPLWGMPWGASIIS